jgi:hypothetical protein
MITEAKNILEQTVQKIFPGMLVVRSMADEQHAQAARKWPYVSLITNPGGFDDRKAKTVRYADVEAKTWKQRYVRGERWLPIQMRCWGEGEEAVDVIFSRLLPAIPRHWEYDGFEGSVLINGEEHSDIVGNKGLLYLSCAEIEFAVDVATGEEIVPTIDQFVNEGGDYQAL